MSHLLNGQATGEDHDMTIRGMFPRLTFGRSDNINDTLGGCSQSKKAILKFGASLGRLDISHSVSSYNIVVRGS
ncbi:hypothetical protein RC96_17055 [Pectobacterium carotovorum subsp. carotovorum]|nr:hypothetical protein RC84_10545 [Pectobacterium carotovorum subsp. carotovorum]KHT14358.1 hypothetical protein RC96_17055 [Pectobacterium carotovorum subsp. carotovorum]